jgi:nicotinamidase/pyrazinamidase
VTRYDPATALIVVDCQNDFADPGGSLYVAGGEDTIPFINREIADAVESGSSVVYTQDWHPASTPHFAKDGGIWPTHCVAETWGAEFHPGLDVVGRVVQKGTGGEDGYSGFTVRNPETGEETPTGLAAMLAERSIEKVIIVGLATDYCVKATAVDAAHEGLTPTVLADGIRPVNLAPGDGARAVGEMVAGGVQVV